MGARQHTSWSLLLGALVLTACGDDRRSTTPPEPEAGILTFDAAMIRFDGATPPSDGSEPMPADGGGTRDGGSIRDGGVDAGAPIDGYPDVPRMHVGHPDWIPLTLLLHNVVQDPDTDFEEIFLVVRNDHPTLTYCSIVFRVEFFDSAGRSITFRTGTFDGDPRRIYSVDADCIPPGTTGLGYGNSSWSLALDEVARIDYLFNGSGGMGSDVRTIATVVNEDRMIVDPYGSGTYWAVQGTLRVLSGSVRSPDVTVFPLDERGLPFADLGDIELIDVPSGSSWMYRTTTTQERFSTYLHAHSYRGTSSALVAGSVEAQRALDARDHHEALAREAELRRIPRIVAAD